MNFSYYSHLHILTEALLFMKKLKRMLIVVLLLLTAFTVYVISVNRNTVNMTARQKILKAVYPAWMWLTRLTGTNRNVLANEKAQPPVSFYRLRFVSTDGNPFDFAQLKGKKVLLVNTASDCGYTDQYADLQKLYEQQKDKLVIVGFPANDFKQQEKGSNEEIAAFCKKNYGVTFPMMQKSTVIKTAAQNPVFQWLTDVAKNGWNSKAPVWNFSKYLVNEEGRLVNYFEPGISPLSEEIIKAVTNR